MYEDRPPIRTREGGNASLQEGAIRNLSFIRDTMERSASFTAVSGWGGVVVGVFALFATVVASSQPTESLWLLTWIATSFVGLLITVVATFRKATRLGIPVLSGAARKFMVGMAPSLLAGAVLTFVLFQNDLAHLLTGMWLLLYGAGVVTAGITSVTVIRVLGVCFMLLGTATFLLPPEFGDLMMASGFGGLNLFFGIYIVRNHGG